MPGGNISQLERFQRLHKIKELVDAGKSQSEISTELGIPLKTIQRNVKYLDDLNVADLTSKEVAEKRSELYLELIEATEEAKDMFIRYKDNDNPIAARKFFMSWLEAIEMRAKLYGLDSIKVGSLTQINNQFNSPAPDVVDIDTGRKIAKMIIDKHESKLRDEFKEEV